MNSQIKVLRHARELIEAGWTQRAFARNEAGIVVDEYDGSATCFCAVGALRRARINLHLPYYVEIEVSGAITITLQSTKGVDFITDYNDKSTRTKEDILALFDLTIERLDSAQSVA